jgi:hypothetical protein
MVHFRIWLRGRVSNVVRTSHNKTRHLKHRKANIYNSPKDFCISGPVLVGHDSDDLEPPSVESVSNSQFVHNIKEPSPERCVKHSAMEVEIFKSIDAIMEDGQKATSSSTTLIEEIEAPPSLYEDSEDDTVPEDLWPATPSSIQRTSRCWSTVQGLGLFPDHTTMALPSRPQSYLGSNNSGSYGADRLSYYSVMDRDASSRNRRASMPNRTVFQTNKRASMLSESSSKANKRASVVSDRTAYSGLSGTEWEERRLSRRVGRRMSWGFETYQTHTSAYAPVRV